MTGGMVRALGLGMLFGASLGTGTLLSCAQEVQQRSPDEVHETTLPSTHASTLNGSQHPQVTSFPAVSGPPRADESTLAQGTSSPALSTFDYLTLRALEAQGFGFESMALGLTPSPGAVRDNSVLKTDVGYASIAKTLTADLDEFAAADKRAGVGMRFAHRVFDKRWLVSSKFHYELVAIVQRLDRRVFTPATCGELRMVYRLAYTSQVGVKPVESRVPMTVNVVRFINDPGCQRWLAAMTRVDERDQLDAAARWTAVGAPLSTQMLELTSLKSVEVNLQSVRWPSTVRPNMAGHAEYLLRVFQRTDPTQPFQSTTLENTPDVGRLKRDRGLRQKLSDWLSAPGQSRDIAQGTIRVPDEFLATRVTSVAPHGLARQGNRPFSVLLLDSWAERADAGVLLRRLDGLSCPGCHQSRSVAGFHVLGNESAHKQADRLALPHSAHFTDEMRRRRTYVTALAQGRAPDEYRPPAEHPEGAGSWGSRCGIDAAGPFSDYDCAAGFTCQQVDDPQVGECVPLIAEVGDACEPGSSNWDEPTRDRVRLASASSCGPGRVCERNAVGFPGGMCSSDCDGLNADTSVCGGIAVLDSFNACVARGEVFETCLATTTRPGALRKCSHEAPCRDDYVCAAMPGGEGACLPPYFLFQLRVDGHVIE